MKEEKLKYNYSGQTPTNIPSEELINPPRRKGQKKKGGRKT